MDIFQTVGPFSAFFNEIQKVHKNGKIVFIYDVNTSYRQLNVDQINQQLQNARRRMTNA